MYYPMYHSAQSRYVLPIIITFFTSVMSIPIIKEI